MVVQNPDIDAYGPKTGDFRNRVCLAALGTDDYTDLDSQQQTSIDLVINERFQFVFQRAERIALDDISDSELPDEFQQLFYEECVYAVIRDLRGAAKAEERKPELLRLWDDVLTNYSPASPSTSSDISFKAIDRYVTAITMRTERRLLVPLNVLDQVVKHEFGKLWNSAKWPFRTRQVTLQIDTDGNLTGDIDGTFDATLARYFYYSDDQNQRLEWVSDDAFARARVRYKGETGRPRWFRIQDEGTEKKILLEPTPDQTYSIYTAVTLATPSLPSSRTSSTGFEEIPADVRVFLWDMVLASVLYKFGQDVDSRRHAGQLMQSVKSDLANLASEAADLGRSGIDIGITDVYADAAFFASNDLGPF